MPETLIDPSLYRENAPHSEYELSFAKRMHFQGALMEFMKTVYELRPGDMTSEEWLAAYAEPYAEAVEELKYKNPDLLDRLQATEMEGERLESGAKNYAFDAGVILQVMDMVEEKRLELEAKKRGLAYPDSQLPWAV